MSTPSTSPESIIEAYVLDVVKRLPRRQRNDVGAELRSLLGESLRDRAGDAGRKADHAMALDLLREFGRPEDVAARYHPPGPPVIPPSQTVAFAWTALIGVGLQWAISLPGVINGQLLGDLPVDARIGAWWVTYGLGALWLPGFLVTVALVAALIRRRWPAAQQDWKPRHFDRDHVNRPAHIAGLVAALAGIVFWIGHAWLVMTTSTPYSKALAFAPDFMATRAPVVLVYWTLTIVQMIVVIAEGRWRPLTRRIALGLQLAGAAMMLWFVVGGRIFMTDAADQTAKGALALIAALVLLDAAAKLWRGRSKFRAPDVHHGEAQRG